jgi:hypothetical protein
MSNKFEKLIEYIINDEDSKARALFREYIIEKSRDIYENMLNGDLRSPVIREYNERLEKIGDIYGGVGHAKSEGEPVGVVSKDTKKVDVNVDAIVGPGNDFGGTTENLNQEHHEESPDDKDIPEPKNEYSKNRGELPGAGKFKNVPVNSNRSGTGDSATSGRSGRSGRSGSGSD